MHQQWYCSRCARQLPQGSNTRKCPYCKTGFDHPNAIHEPEADPDNEWFARRGIERDDRRKVGPAFISFFVRLVISALIFISLAALIVISALSYHAGGGQSLVSWVLLALIGLPVWTFWPPGKLIAARLGKAQS